MATLDLIEFPYRNYKNEVEQRHARPIELWFGCTAWHPEAQWHLRAFDVDRCGTRDFALSGLLGPFRPWVPGRPGAPVSDGESP